MGAHGLRLLRVKAGGNMDKIHLAIDHLGKLHSFIDLQTALDLLAAGHTVFDQEFIPHPLAHTVDDHEGKFGAVFQTAAVAVRALVVIRREELAQKPAVAAVQQAHIIARILEQRGAFGEMLGHIVHILLGHGAHLNAVPVAVEIHRPDRFAAMISIGRGIHTGVVQLMAGDGAALMDGHGDLRNIRQDRVAVVIIEIEAARIRRRVLAVNGRIAQRDHRRAAARFLGIIRDHGRHGIAIGIHHAHHIRRGKQAVAECEALEREAFKQMRIVFVHGYRSPF